MSVSSYPHTPHALHGQLGDMLHDMAVRMSAHAERRGRHAEIARLEAKSDAELAALGIQSRDQIAAHVFRDLFYV
ncbi:hypothetical protein RNZ50_04780 [Paracoccaceae bacterium Fryx2]|nr:hypothetical protein [Paracoccaceae bacterium Fryx2]